MTTSNNAVLGGICYVFDFDEDKTIAIFGLADRAVTGAEVSAWLAKEEDPAHVECPDAVLASFLNGLIIDKRGPRDGPPRPPESEVSNNLVMTKLKIALAYSGDDVMAVLVSVGQRMSKHELSALYRKPGHKHFRKCSGEVLFGFIEGLQKKLRPDPTPAGAAT
ncbi:MAG: DUF1456 family protein [Deltaproteobacteria bacterium]|nr:DUF1456 family protein [Deltaproteobacteria bacterium]